MPYSLRNPFAKCGMGEYGLCHVLQRQLIDNGHRKLANHIRGPGSHHLGAQDTVAFAVRNYLYETALLLGEKGFSIG